MSLSCTREEPDMNSPEKTEGISATLSLSIEDLEAGTPETKAVMEPDVPSGETIENQINNFAVLQFEGNDANAKLIAPPDFVQDLATYFTTKQVNLLPTSDNHPGPFVIVVVANIGGSNELPGVGKTLESFLRSYYSLDTYASVFTKREDREYLRMSASALVTDRIDDTFSIQLSLKRNVSKITIHVNNETEGEEKVTFEKAQIRDINAKYYYLTNNGSGIGTFQDDYSAMNPCRIDKAQENLPEPEADGSYTFTFYVPANLRGTTSSEYQFTKGLDAPAGATRFCLYGTYGSNHTPINYTYYLGGNLVNDFNLKPNHHYTYNLTLKNKGDDRFDYRIEDLAEVKFHTDANCYMVHPPKVQGQSRIYAVPIRRAAVFWNDPGVNGGVYGANQFETDAYAACKIDAETQWTAEVLWSDFKLPEDFMQKTSGKGYDPTDPTQDPYFCFRIDAGMRGNVVIAVRIGETIVWSWHIWITDYNPDQERLTPETGKYIYTVEGGQVHRYNNDLFNKTAPTETTEGYKNGFIMDRNLGASGTSYEDTEKGGMYYQFGRKDPFFVWDQRGRRYYYYKNGTTQTYLGSSGNQLWQGDTPYRIQNVATGEPGGTADESANNIRYAVCNPMRYIYCSDKMIEWTNNFDAIAGTGVGWLDPKYFEHNGDQHILEIKKSIYDPCPPGWKVPHQTAFKDIAAPKHTETINNVEYTTYPLEDNPKIEFRNSGLYYYPKGKESPEAIYFPAMAYRVASHAGFSGDKYIRKEGRIWTNYTSLNETSGSLFFFRSDECGDPQYRTSYGYNVRCVREYGAVVK